jgi:hypothetical protein
VPVVRLLIVVLVPVPLVVVPPGVLVNVHVPTAGSPFRTTLPVDTVQEGCVVVPATGAVGVAGCASMVTVLEAAEVHPEALVTV